MIIGIILVLSLNSCGDIVSCTNNLISDIYVDIMDGDIRNVELVIGTSEKYSETEIIDAAETVKDYFKEIFGGSTLHKLQYDEELSLREEKSLRKQNKNTRDYIILKSELTTGKFSSPGLDPNHFHTYHWILIKNKDNQWEVDGCGY